MSTPAAPTVQAEAVAAAPQGCPMHQEVQILKKGTSRRTVYFLEHNPTGLQIEMKTNKRPVERQLNTDLQQGSGLDPDQQTRSF